MKVLREVTRGRVGFMRTSQVVRARLVSEARFGKPIFTVELLDVTMITTGCLQAIKDGTIEPDMIAQQPAKSLILRHHSILLPSSLRHSSMDSHILNPSYSFYVDYAPKARCHRLAIPAQPRCCQPSGRFVNLGLQKSNC